MPVRGNENFGYEEPSAAFFKLVFDEA